MSDATSSTVGENNDPLSNPEISKETVTNDAVAGETVIDNGHYAGPTGSEPLEAEPDAAPSDLEGDPVDLSDEENLGSS